MKEFAEYSPGVCMACGEPTKHMFGFYVKYHRHGRWGIVQMRYCGQCAKKYVPIIENAVDTILREGGGGE